MIVRYWLFARAKKSDKGRNQTGSKTQEDSPSLLGNSTTELTTAGPNGKAMTGAWVGTPRSQRLPPPGGFTPSPGGGFGQSPRRRTNASSPAGTPLTDTPVRRPSRAGQKGKYSIITSLDDDEDPEAEPRPGLGRTNSLYSSEYMRDLRKNAGPLPTSYNVIPNPDTEKLPPTYFAVAPGPSGSGSPARVTNDNVESNNGAGQRTVVPMTREFNRAYSEAKFPKRPTGFPASTSSLALVGEEEPLPCQSTSTNASTATLIAALEDGGDPQTRAQSWVTFRVPDMERSRSSSPRYPPGLEPQTEEEEMEQVEADIAYEGASLEDEDDDRGLLESLKAEEDAEDSSLPYRSSKARSRAGQGDGWYERAGTSAREGETTPRRPSPQQQATPARRPLPPTPTQALVSPTPFTAWPHPPRKEHEEDEDEVQWGTTIRLLNAEGSMRSATTADSDDQFVTGRAI
ncbi:hypothetical protein FRC05_008534 [Tulasnella sp. 425]|nr:hypothetical protein FRC05_008534 [Tulasnella sp. 425]